MNLAQAEAIAVLYEELIKSIDHSTIPLPRYNTGNFKWQTDDISRVYLDDGYITVKWSRYRGCGESTTEETTLSLDTLFQ